jgi:queuosine precursor transporter
VKNKADCKPASASFFLENEKSEEASSVRVFLLVALYVVAIVAANLSVAAFGPSVAILNAFLFIGLDITSRDSLHQAWQGKNLWLKMAALIATGSLLSWLLNRNAGAIALASFLAFAASSVADTLTFQLLRHRAWWVKVNGSNVVSAAVDSCIFPLLAFGALWPVVVVGQFLAKVAGGALWSLILGFFQGAEKFPGPKDEMKSRL